MAFLGGWDIWFWVRGIMVMGDSGRLCISGINPGDMQLGITKGLRQIGLLLALC